MENNSPNARVRGAEEGRFCSAATLVLVFLFFAYPVLVCAIFFPSPFSDLREQINWSSLWPLYTWKHPPMQTWIAGVVALTGARDAWPFVLTAQILNLTGLYFLVRIAKAFLDGNSADAVAVAICGSVLFVAWGTTRALNADDLLFPLWSGILFFYLQAVTKGRWRDWLVVGALGGLAMLTKYSSAAFLGALAVAALASPALRPTVLVKPAAYAAVILCVLIFSVNAVPMLQHSTALSYASRSFNLAANFSDRLGSLVSFLFSIAAFNLPFLAAVGFCAVKRHEALIVQAPEGPARLIVVLAAMLFCFICGCILILDLSFAMRYYGPFLGINLLAFLAIVRPNIATIQLCRRVALWTWGCTALATAAYAFSAVNSILREPAQAAAATIRNAWDEQFSCGPAYIVGEGHRANGVAIYFGRSVLGASNEDYFNAGWIDKPTLLDLGAILIGPADFDPDRSFPGEFPIRTHAAVLKLAYRRSLSTRQHEYVYFFVPPRSCGGPPGR
jgi:hypothetical protein